MMTGRGWIGAALLLTAVPTLAVAQARDTRTQRQTEAQLEREMQRALRSTEWAMHAAQLEMQHALAGTGHAIQEAQLQMALLSPHLAESHLRRADLEAALAGVHDLTSTRLDWQQELNRIEPESNTALPQDPADSLWRQGRERMNRGEFERAAELFRRIRTEARFERSGYRAESYYWEAFSLARLGNNDQLRQAREILARMKSQYPNDSHIRDADQLAASIDGRLARSGDAAAAESLYRAAAIADGSRVRSRNQPDPQCANNEEEDIRIAALSALLNVDSDRTLPVLRDVMARRDPCSAPLRRRALMLISRTRDPGAAQILINTARNDPDPEIRQQAVLFLGNVRTPEATTALQSFLRESTDVELQRHAFMALVSQRGEESTRMLREYATREDAPLELRRQAVMMLIGRRGEGAENVQLLRDLFGRTRDAEMKQSIILALGRMRDAESANWLMNVALDRNNTSEVRRQALFLAGQSESITFDRLSRLYDEATDTEMKEQVLFTLARRNEAAAVDKLIAIARNETDVELRKKAIFWLGQSKDPRASEALLDIIRR